MIKIIVLFFLLAAGQTFAQEISIIKINDLQNLLNSKGNEVQVINFWATWCAPCVKELPLFERLEQEKTDDVSITLINLDFADKVGRVETFVARKKITSKVQLLDEIDYNSWIDQVDKNWGGAIPATLVLNTRTGKRKFIERELKEGELQQIIAETRQ